MKKSTSMMTFIRGLVTLHLDLILLVLAGSTSHLWTIEAAITATGRHFSPLTWNTLTDSPSAKDQYIYQVPPEIEGCSNRIELSECVQRFSNNLCYTDPKMALNCARVCGFCQPPKRPSSQLSLTTDQITSCHDHTVTCLSRALHGACSRDAPMEADCAYTCGFCNKPYDEASLVQCLDWPSRQFCLSNAKRGKCVPQHTAYPLMLRLCPSTCGLCKEIENFFIIEREDLIRKWRIKKENFKQSTNKGTSPDYLSDDENAETKKNRSNQSHTHTPRWLLTLTSLFLSIIAVIQISWTTNC